jgi:CHAT domain-containing protein
LLLAGIASSRQRDQGDNASKIALIGAFAAVSPERQTSAMPLLARQRRMPVPMAPLQHGLDELAAVGTAVGAAQVTALLDAETLMCQSRFARASLASADAVLAAMSGASMVHVVAHALFNSELPMESIILLDSKAENGWITAADMMTVNFGTARLVVLSACGTAQGRAAVGAEVFGFLRALMAGGAQAMVLTRWPIDDTATTRFFEIFYEALQRDSAAEALRQAATKTARAHAHPFFWSSPTLYGWWRSSGVGSAP